MRKLLEHCPACHGPLIVTQMSCMQCDTVVLGSFQPNIFSRLSPDSLAFLVNFVKNKGNVKEMERETGLSYWTIRNRLNDVIEELGFEAAAAPDPEALQQQRQAILARLERGEMSVDEAARLLEQLQE
ncbi:MAG: DUF2089 domain-containing protein [Anaerolineales bacterium]|nr:DUF2089 domain-containing protein [Anaerolineales bacterium]